MNYEKTIAKHFTDRASRYDEYGNWVNNDVILSAILNAVLGAAKRSVDIIDIGSGTGAVSKYMIDKLPQVHSVYAVDICKEMLDKIDDPRIKKVIASAESLPFYGNSFDVALSRQCLHYVEDLNKCIMEIHRVLRDNGIFVLGQIIPCEENTKEYWSQLMRIRQPLRIHYFSQNDWIQVCSDNGFRLLFIQNLKTKGSLDGWVKKYHITESSQIKKYRYKLLSAPLDYKNKYQIDEVNNNIEYTTYWSIMCFIKENTIENFSGDYGVRGFHKGKSKNNK